MRKFTIVVAIAFLCSFAVVRRRQDEEQAEDLFKEAVTKIVDDGTLAFHAMEAEDAIGNSVHPLQDQPVDAANILNSAFNEVIRVDDGFQEGWVMRSTVKPVLFRQDGHFTFFLN